MKDNSIPAPLPWGMNSPNVAVPCLGYIENPDGYAYLRGECGDSLEVFVSVTDRTVSRARFDALGCEYTLACGNAAMELAEGQTFADAFRISPRDICVRVGDLPESHMHCAELAVDTLRKALEDSLARQDGDWKKLYRSRAPGTV